MIRRTLLVSLLATSVLAGCGFHLRSSQNYAFQTLAVTPEKGGLVATELIRYFGRSIVPVVPVRGSTPPQLIVDILEEVREKTVVGLNAAGQVREFQLKLRIKMRVRTPLGKELIAPTDVVQQRDISFNESAVLAKEVEESLLYRDMQSDIVQQVLRRLSALKSVD
jgi:LPS-assembly lipoprotein